MSSSQASAYPTGSEGHSTGLLGTLVPNLARRNRPENVNQSSWKPSAFSPATLIVAILLAWALIAIVQFLLVRSEQNGGIILASTIDDIAFAQSFEYLYLPTIIALAFSIFWSWIDLQVKRVEPYHQLSKEDGAWGKDSLLMSYPFDFLPFVPLSAFRSRHWAVFWASICVVSVTWGLVPLQAGIFATETITRSSPVSILRSESFMSADEQPLKITGRYIQSAHGIMWLNETLPPYMTRDYILAPFTSNESVTDAAKNVTWTSDTTLYSLDMGCEVPTVEYKNTTQYSGLNSRPTTVKTTEYMSSNGCGFPTEYYDSFGNETIGPNPSFQNQSVYDTKAFATAYIGYYQSDFADFYLETLCPETSNHTFMALYTRNKQSADDPPQNVTRLYCTPFYYEQEVSATIDVSTGNPLNVIPRGEKVPLSSEKWNSSFFEYQMNTGRTNKQPRDSLPLQYWPDQMETVSTLNLSLGVQSVVLSSMAGFAIGATNHTLEELLDPEALRNAYEAAYRIIFARSMAEILIKDFSIATSTNGTTEYSVAAVIVVPVFAYIVEGLLGFISICSIALFTISLRRKWMLRSDPSTIASIMALVSDNPSLLNDFAKLDRVKMDEFEEYIGNKKFLLEHSERGNAIAEADSFDPLDNDAHGIIRIDSSESQAPTPVRPREFRSFMVAPFVILLIGLAIALGVLLAKSQPHGIIRPSTTIVRQIVENYIPTALATLIEPVWILINRLLCLLQPLEELRGGKAAAQKSIDVDYSSLPPQLVMFKALRSSHFKLAVVCLMALLANVLAVAFSGVFEERSIVIPATLSFVPPFEHKFVSINGSVGPNTGISDQQRLELKPSGAYTGGQGENHFLVAESNYSAGTPLPAWTDDRFMYMPFVDETNLGASNTEDLRAQTTAIGAELECRQLQAQDWEASWFSDALGYAKMNISVTMNGTTCERTDFLTYLGPRDPGMINEECQGGSVAMEIANVLGPRQNASVAEQNLCAEVAIMAYFRDTNICSRNTTTTVDKQGATFFGCRSRLVGGDGDVGINREGRVQTVYQRNATSDLSPAFLEKHFDNDASNLLRQGNSYLLPLFTEPVWHNESYATDFMNYFMIQHGNQSRLTDPTLPLPSLDELTRNLYPVYSKIFAIWLGIHKSKLLVPRGESSNFFVQGLATERQTRIFLSMPLFIIAQVILGVYVFVAICIYLWRPGRFLPRMPTSIGAIIALFAASQAVRDMRGTSLLTRKERRKHLQNVGGTYGYGTFIGSDAKLHEGIEKEPLVDAVPLPGVVEKLQTGFSSKSSMFKRSPT